LTLVTHSEVLPLEMVDNSIRPPSTFFRLFFLSSLGSPDRPPHPGVRLHASASASTFTHLPTRRHCNPIWLQCLSSGNGQQWARQDLARRPFSIGSPGCHGWRPMPVALRLSVAPAYSGLYSRHAQGAVRAHKVIISTPPFQMSKQVWSLLGSRPSMSRKG